MGLWLAIDGVNLDHHIQNEIHSYQAGTDRYIQDLISKKNYQLAENLIRERIRRNPTDPDAFYLLGIWNYFQGRLSQAVENLKKALHFNPGHTDSAICLSVLLNDVGKYDDAKRVFEQANQSVVGNNGNLSREIDIKFSVKHLEIADLYLRYRRYDEAIEEYSKAALLDPRSLDIRIRRAKAFAKKGFVTRAMQELYEIKKESPQFLPARIQLGLLHYSQGNILDAEIEWDSALEIEPNHREVTAYLAMARESRARQQ